MSRRFSEQELIRRKKAEELKELGVEPFGYKMDATHTSQEFINEFDKYSKEELSSGEFATVTLAGRIKGKRGPFITLEDYSGNWQSYVPKKELDEKTAKIWNSSDIGDIIAISGTPMKTGTGVLSVRLTDFHHIVKALRPLPDDYYGLQDKEERYRRRYVDLIMRPHVKETFQKRSAIMKYLRNFLDNQGYLEVETPVLQPILGGASARPFVTHHNTLDMPFYLRIATELPLKRCIVGGIPKVYEIGRLFRNEGMDATHNPEFTTIELYEAYSDMNGMMKLAEDFISKVNKHVNGKHKIVYQGRDINLSAPFNKIHMVDFIKQETGVDFWNITDMQKAKEVAKEHGVHVEKHHTGVGYIINSFFEEFCEDKVTDPVFVYGHPVEISPLAKKNPNNSRFTERFELFIDGKEFANAFTELNDPIDQYERFEEQVREKDQGNDEATEMDLDFVEALEHAMPPTGGMGIGLDRLVMLLTDNHSIRDVLLFPHMKPRG